MADLRTEVGRLDLFVFTNLSKTDNFGSHPKILNTRWSLENAASLVFDRRLNWDETWGKMMVRGSGGRRPKSFRYNILSMSIFCKVPLLVSRSLRCQVRSWDTDIQAENTWNNRMVGKVDLQFPGKQKAESGS